MTGTAYDDVGVQPADVTLSSNTSVKSYSIDGRKSRADGRILHVCSVYQGCLDWDPYDTILGLFKISFSTFWLRELILESTRFLFHF